MRAAFLVRAVIGSGAETNSICEWWNSGLYSKAMFICNFSYGIFISAFQFFASVGYFSICLPLDELCTPNLSSIQSSINSFLICFIILIHRTSQILRTLEYYRKELLCPQGQSQNYIFFIWRCRQDSFGQCSEVCSIFSSRGGCPQCWFGAASIAN